MELVSVIIPTYGCRGHLKDSIDSVISQTYNPLEIIVVDDNSPDSTARKETESIMAGYISNPIVCYLKHTMNRNGAAARNTGINASHGEFIAFLDDDDTFLPEKIERQVDFLHKNLEYDAVYCLAKKNGKNYSGTFYEGQPIKEMLMLETCMYTPCLMFRRDALLSINGFDEALRRHQDYDLLIRFFAAGHSIGCLKEVLSEIGSNAGENSPGGQKLEDLKTYFFSKFDPYIREINEKESGFRKKVYAKHYAGVFLRHVKNKDFRLAFKAFSKYFPYSPKQFTEVIKGSIKAHLS